MAEYSNVEKPFPEKLKSLGWKVFDHGPGGIPQDTRKSYRNSLNDVVLEDVFRKTVRKILIITDFGEESLASFSCLYHPLPVVFPKSVTIRNFPYHIFHFGRSVFGGFASLNPPYNPKIRYNQKFCSHTPQGRWKFSW